MYEYACSITTAANRSGESEQYKTGDLPSQDRRIYHRVGRAPDEDVLR